MISNYEQMSHWQQERKRNSKRGYHVMTWRGKIIPDQCSKGICDEYPFVDLCDACKQGILKTKSDKRKVFPEP